LANLDGTNTCFAFSSTFTSLNCRAHTDAFGTVTGRVGWAFRPDGRSLAYVKGGLAWGHSQVDTIINNPLFAVAGTSSASVWAWGGTVGAGAEYATTPHWTVKAEYDYINLGNPGFSPASPSVTTVPAGGPAVGAFVTVPGANVSQQIHVFKLGVNYKFGPDAAPFADGFGWPAAASVAYPGKAPVYEAKPLVAWAPGWEVEVGARYWYSSGRFQKDRARQSRSAEPDAQYLQADLG
jgi:hypothetical protein